AACGSRSPPSLPASRRFSTVSWWTGPGETSFVTARRKEAADGSADRPAWPGPLRLRGGHRPPHARSPAHRPGKSCRAGRKWTVVGRPRACARPAAGALRAKDSGAGGREGVAGKTLARLLWIFGHPLKRPPFQKEWLEKHWLVYCGPPATR